MGNTILLALLLAYMCWKYCLPTKQDKVVKVKEIVYEDGTSAAYPFAGVQQSILPGGQHEYVFRDKRMTG